MPSDKIKAFQYGEARQKIIITILDNRKNGAKLTQDNSLSISESHMKNMLQSPIEFFLFQQQQFYSSESVSFLLASAFATKEKQEIGSLKRAVRNQRPSLLI